MRTLALMCGRPYTSVVVLTLAVALPNTYFKGYSTSSGFVVSRKIGEQEGLGSRKVGEQEGLGSKKHLACSPSVTTDEDLQIESPVLLNDF